VLAVVIAVDRLPKKRDLGGALIGKPPDLPNHIGQLAAPLWPARHRNDAERAPIIAAALHRHESRDRVAADRRNVFVVLPALERDVSRTLAGARVRDQLGKPAVAIRTDDEVDLRDPLQQFGTEPLCHASHHAKYVAGTLVAFQLAHPSQDPLLRVIAHRARVHEQHVRLGGIVRAHVPGTGQDAEHQLGV